MAQWYAALVLHWFDYMEWNRIELQCMEWQTCLQFWLKRTSFGEPPGFISELDLLLTGI
jgi:hypothetical protein